MQVLRTLRQRIEGFGQCPRNCEVINLQDAGLTAREASRAEREASNRELEFLIGVSLPDFAISVPSDLNS